MVAETIEPWGYQALTSFFIKGCRSQLNWLCYCLQFLEKNWMDRAYEVVVMVDEDCKEVIRTWGPIKNVIYCYCQPWPDPYMHALWCKANADMFTRGDPIILLDCDTLLMEPVNLAEYIDGGERRVTKILLPYLEWRDRGDNGGAQSIWPGIVKRSTGYDLDKDYMVSRPWIFARSTFYGARLMVEQHKNMPFYAATYSDHPYKWEEYARHPFTFCDLENLGLYAAKFQEGTYRVRDLAQWKGRRDCFKDYWSHTPWTAELVDHLEGHLTAPV
jgi:hypothetical protein